jgi:hypothetical protein
MKLRKNKMHTRLGALLVLSAMLAAPAAALLPRPAGCRPARAGGGAAWTIRLHSAQFLAADAPSVSGIEGIKYKVSLKQAKSASAAIELRLYYNSDKDSGVKYLSVESGKLRGEGYLEFKLADYDALSQWSVSFQNKSYIVYPGLTDADVSLDGRFETVESILKDAPPSTVYDADDKQLFFLPGGTVINQDYDCVFDDDGRDSLEILYRDGVFKNSLGVEMQVGEQKQGNGAGQTAFAPQMGMLEGARKKYLLSTDIARRAVTSVTKDKAVYKVRVREKEADGGGQYDILCLYSHGAYNPETTRVEPLTDLQHVGAWLSIAFTGRDKYDLYFDLAGRQIDPERYEAFYPGATFWESMFGMGDYKLTQVGTIGQYVDEILLAGEPYTEDRVVDLSTGEQLYDDIMSPISLQNGQFIDGAGYPVIGADGYPCYKYEGNYYSIDPDGNKHPLAVNSQKQLVDRGVTVHSSTVELQEGMEIYYSWMKDNTTSMPARMIYDGDGTYHLETVYGDEINKNLIGRNNYDFADRFKMHPDEKPEDASAWDRIVAALKLAGVALLAIAAAILAAALLVWMSRFIRRAVRRGARG